MSCLQDNLPRINAIEKAYPIPEHIQAIARAIRHDLYNGPSYVIIPQGDVTKFDSDCSATYRADLEEIAKEGDIIEECYTGIAAQALRDFIAELPSDLWYDRQGGELYEHEPEGCEDDETGEYIEPEYEDWYNLEHKDIVEVLFGKTIAKEFN